MTGDQELEPEAAATKIAPSKVRYIKLGTGNAWFEDCRANNRLELGHRAIPHDLAMTRDKNAVAALYLSDERTAAKATNYAREVLDFYDGDENALWITFAEGCLWWAFAKAEVVTVGESQEQGQRARAVIGSWSNRDANGNLLTFGSLSTSLTQVAAYRRTICSVKAAGYAVRRIGNALATKSGPGKATTTAARRLGQYLGKYDGRVFGGLAIRVRVDAKRGNLYWLEESQGG